MPMHGELRKANKSKSTQSDRSMKNQEDVEVANGAKGASNHGLVHDRSHRHHESIYTRDVVLVMSGAFFFMFSTMSINPLINGYAQQLGASDELAGIIAGIMSFAAMFLRPITGHLADRYSKYLLSTIVGVLIIAGTVGYPLTHYPALLLLFRIINGIGYVLCTVCVSTWIALLVPRTHVGEAMGLYGLMNALAMSLAPAVSISLYHAFGYRRGMILPPISAALMVLLLQFVSDHGLPHVARAQRQQHLTQSSHAKNAKNANDLNDSTVRRKRTHSFALIQKDAAPVGVLTTLFALPYFITQADIVRYTEELQAKVNVSVYFLIYAAVLLVIRLAFKRQFDTVRYGVWFWISLAGTALYLLCDVSLANNAVMALSAIFMAVGYGIIYSTTRRA